ncbi:MAG: radical SAM protein [Sphingomonadales bacterium]|nr:radical SAM protein [Sphingomonadales bacterium]
MTAAHDMAPDEPRLHDTPPAVAKFTDPLWTAKGERRAHVAFGGLDTLWINTGTLCNITCVGCYIESSPKNDALAYITAAEVAAVLDEVEAAPVRAREIGFTGGEPFMNPDFLAMLEDALGRGFKVLVLTNAMKPMQLKSAALLDINSRYKGLLRVRVSVDHHEPDKHEAVRGPRTWQPAMDGIAWLASNGFDLAIAGRLLWGESEADLRAGYGRFFAKAGIALDATDPVRLVLFPEMEGEAHVPEITEACWGILNTAPDSMMCASQRMVVKRKGAAAPVYVACTLIPYDPRFEMGASLAEASRPVSLNHRHCAKFCVLGGATCSAR